MVRIFENPQFLTLDLFPLLKWKTKDLDFNSTRYPIFENRLSLHTYSGGKKQ